MSNSHIHRVFFYVCVFMCELTLLGSVLVTPHEVCDDSDVFSGRIAGDVGSKFPGKLTETKDINLAMMNQSKTNR